MTRPVSPADPSPNAFERIEVACRRFRDRCKGGERPVIEEYLREFDDAARINAFRNLLNIDLEFRRRGKENPSADEYLRRFPQFAKLIRQSFFMSTMMSMQASINTPMTHSGEAAEQDHTMSFVVPAANQLGDYQLIQELGRGGFGVVYEARHQQRRNHVALKTLPLGQDHHGLGDAERLHKFRREFRSLADVNHPNLIGMQTLEVDGGQWFFTMDLIDGEDFISYVRPEGELDETRLRIVLPQLANGIMALHGQHIVHRDLKPSNVLVDAEGKVTILDFGLVIEIAQRTDQTQSMQSARFAGTPVYAAPEQIVGQSTAASDWYALGVMLYEALSGQRPYQGAVQEIFEQKRHGETPSLQHRDDLPSDLSELAYRLMQTDPQQRADALVVAQALSLDTKSRSQTLSTDSSQELEIGESGEVLIGREQQLAALEQLRQRLVNEGQPLAVFITGRSGEGKTSLAEAFLQPLRTPHPTLSPSKATGRGNVKNLSAPVRSSRSQAPAWERAVFEAPPRLSLAEPAPFGVPRQEPGNEGGEVAPGNEEGEGGATGRRDAKVAERVLVLSGRCYDRETVPFKAIDSIIDSLVSFLRGRSEEQLTRWLPKDTRMLAHLFPVLGRVGPIAEMLKIPIAQLDSKQIRYRAFHALRELLANISQSTPIVMFVDDLQWGDADSASVLYTFLTHDSPPALLLVGSYRRDEAEESPFLKEWDKLKADQPRELLQPNIAVGPLSEAQCVALVIHRIGVDTESIREKASEIFRSTGGNPYFLDQLIDCYDPETGSFRAAPLHEVIERKLSKLSADALPLLKYVAISGRALGVAEASQAAGQGSAAYATLTHMRNERLVRLIGSKDRELVDTYHDKIRETVLERLEEKERRDLHQTLGETIEQSQSIDGTAILRQLAAGDSQLQPPTYVFDLAYHFEQAGQTDKSLAYSILAAEQAAAQFALANAIDHYHVAEAKLDDANNVIKYRLKYGLGSVLLMAGQYEASNQKLDEAVAVSGNKIEAIQARSLRADIIYKTGSLRDSMAACEAMLRELGLPVPRSEWGKSLGIFAARMKRIFSRSFSHQWSDQSTKSDLTRYLTIKVLLQYAYPCFFSDRGKILWAVSVADELAIAAGNERLKAMAAAFLTLACCWHKCDFGATRRHASASASLALRINDTYVQALSSVHWGSSLVSFGCFAEGVDENRVAHHKFDAIGDVWRSSITAVNIAIGEAQLGHFEASQNLSRNLFHSAIQFGQHRLAMGSLIGWIDSTNAHFPLAELLTTFEQITDDLLFSSWFRGAVARWHLKNGQTGDALRVAESATDILNRLYVYVGGPCVAFPTYAHALRAHAQALESSSPSESGKFRQQAFAAAKKAVRITRKSTCGLPYSLRELSLNYLLAGRPWKSLKYIRESCAVAQRQEAKYEYAESLLVMGQIGEKLGRPGARQQIEQATAALAEFERQRELANIGSLDDRQEPHRP